MTKDLGIIECLRWLNTVCLYWLHLKHKVKKSNKTNVKFDKFLVVQRLWIVNKTMFAYDKT